MPGTSKLDPRFRPIADALLRYARTVDKRFIFTSTKRSATDQARLYARWLKGESPFPALPPGKSFHELGLAVDMVRLNIDPADDEVLAELGEAWKAAGGVWGGTVDPVHFQAPKSWA